MPGLSTLLLAAALFGLSRLAAAVHKGFVRESDSCKRIEMLARLKKSSVPPSFSSRFPLRKAADRANLQGLIALQ